MLPHNSCSIASVNDKMPASAAPPASVPTPPGKRPWPKSVPPYAPVRRATLLDLHLALHLKRRVNSDNQIDFLGRSWHIAPTNQSLITLIHHPLRKFWAVSQPPSPPLNLWPDILGNYSLQPGLLLTSPKKSPFELPPTAQDSILDRLIVSGDDATSARAE
jgi:hypothetical protein